MTSARLNRGDYRTKRTNGIVEVYMYEEQSLATWYTICANTFTDKEAGKYCWSCLNLSTNIIGSSDNLRQKWHTIGRLRPFICECYFAFCHTLIRLENL